MVLLKWSFCRGDLNGKVFTVLRKFESFEPICNVDLKKCLFYFLKNLHFCYIFIYRTFLLLDLAMITILSLKRPQELCKKLYLT